MASRNEQGTALQTHRSKMPRLRVVPKIRTINAIAILLSAALSLMALVTVGRIFETEMASERHDEAYRECSSAARDLQEASDFLTSEVRVFVATGNRAYLDSYLNELEVVDRRGRAVQTLRSYLGDDEQAVADLEEALGYSNALAERELYAMKLVAVSTQMADVPKLVDSVALREDDLALTDGERRMLAEQIVLGEEYQSTKMQIRQSVSDCYTRLLARLNADIETNNATMRRRLGQMQAVVFALLAIVVLVIAAVYVFILRPLQVYTRQIKRDEKLVLTGASELRYLADAYNHIYEENRERTRNLQHAAERDGLTGLYNRGAFDQLLREHKQNVALLLIDVDYFKDVNDTYGHDVGDAILRKVANRIERQFRATDLPCRIGGDEFAVIVTDVTPELRTVIASKVEALRVALTDVSDGLPKVTLSVGIAFSALVGSEQSIFKAADRALYVAKERGHNGYAFYGDDDEQGAATAQKN